MTEPLPPACDDLATLLEDRAARFPDDAFFLMNDLVDSFSALNDKANRFARGLGTLDVRPGEIVAMMMPNAPEFMYAWFGVLKCAAVTAPINTAFRGTGLAHLITLAEARILIIDAPYIPHLAQVSDRLDCLETVIVRGDATEAREVLPFRVVEFEALMTEPAGNPTRPPIGPFDRAMVLFTSGTTGRSKGCVLSQRYLLHHAETVREQFRITRADTLYCPFPLFHADAAYLTVLPALLVGCRAALSERFSASRFWDEIRHYGATVFDFMGATLSILWKQPPKKDDADNPVRLAWGVPMPQWADEFEERFGLQLVEVYGLTDGGVGVFHPLDEPRRPGACGRPTRAYDYRIFDELDRELPAGTIGEIVIRPTEPGVIMTEYLNMPRETLTAMRNLWFHTGDRGFFDDEGYLHFIERKKDAIRRRGENISAFEVEEAANTHPAVLETAAIGVPSELSEEEVMVWVVLREGEALTAEAFIAHCETQMAAYMVPRYVQFVEDLPKTPTEKVEKYRLAERGVGPDTWDREASGTTNGRKPN